MSIARIQIDFTMLDGETLEEVLMRVGDLVMPILDPHEDTDECARWVSIEGYEYADDDFMVTFTPEEDEELSQGVPDIFRQNFENN